MVWSTMQRRFDPVSDHQNIGERGEVATANGCEPFIESSILSDLPNYDAVAQLVEQPTFNR
jgi:hypothetical protein